jgi:hypothetical protein
MGLKKWIKLRSNDLLDSYGFTIVPTDILYEWQRIVVDKSCRQNTLLSDEALDYLKPDNPRLVDLQRRYSAFDKDVTTAYLWNNQHGSAEDIAYFRGDNDWMWQVRGRNANVLGYAISVYYLKSLDHLRLLDKLTEDDNFGNFTFPIAGYRVSRDLLDSILELYFLNRHLGIDSRTGYRVLDVGAGYGRLAHRMLSAFDGVERYFCTDAVAVSTFVSEYYLRFRGISRAVVVPLDEIEKILGEQTISLAINIHSFSECDLKAIEWWVRLLGKHRVKNLMIAPNRSTSGGERLLTNDEQDFLPILDRYGYRLVVKEPKYLDPVVQEFGVQPTWHHLFEFRE